MAECVGELPEVALIVAESRVANESLLRAKGNVRVGKAVSNHVLLRGAVHHRLTLAI